MAKKKTVSSENTSVQEKSFAIVKPSPIVTELFLSELLEEVTCRRMFGCHVGFINGNMIGGTWGDSVMLRLSPAHAEEAREGGAQVFEPLKGKPMKNYLVLPSKFVDSPLGMRKWLGRAASFTGMMPAKLPKPKKSQKVAGS